MVLSEIKRANVTYAPGFILVVAKNKNTQRGGVVTLFKYNVYNEVTVIDASPQEQIWFQPSVPGVMFGGIYIPPSDLAFFSNVTFQKSRPELRMTPLVMWWLVT